MLDTFKKGVGLVRAAGELLQGGARWIRSTMPRCFWAARPISSIACGTAEEPTRMAGSGELPGELGVGGQGRVDVFGLSRRSDLGRRNDRGARDGRHVLGVYEDNAGRILSRATLM